MPVDYSKWDALELSDDSDIEVHPNVDKRSFIRAKQSQIHQQRFERKHLIETYKYERVINDGFLHRIDGLLGALQSHKDDADKRTADELVLQSLMDSTGDADEDRPPPRPVGVHKDEAEIPTYSKMMAALADQVKKEVDQDKGKSRFDAYVASIKSHRAKVIDLQKQLLTKLAELEREEHSKITSESIHTGFDSSYVNKSASEPTTSTGSSSKPSSKTSDKVQAVELLNPAAQSKVGDIQESSGADAALDEPLTGDDDDEIQPTELGKKFAALKPGDYRAYLQFISENPTVINERETDGLLVLAFNSQLDGRDDFARQAVHQALLLQYCRSLGRDGVGLFFKRITTRGHQAQKIFLDDVNDTYNRIKIRVKEINKRKEEEETNGGAGVEQIQLHAVDPGTTINITIPDKDSPDANIQKAREIFESFPPGLQRALEGGRLEEVNKVLGKMSVDEAEEIVGLLGEGGMLSLEEQIIDATTEEGQAQLREFEEHERARGAAIPDEEVDDGLIVLETDKNNKSENISVPDPE